MEKSFRDILEEMYINEEDQSGKWFKGYGAFFFDLKQQRDKKNFEKMFKQTNARNSQITASTESVTEFELNNCLESFIKELEDYKKKLNNGSYLEYK